MKRILYYFLCSLLVTACAKDSGSTVTIKGNLLLSSSNPVPVTDYVLTFCKSGYGGQLDSNLKGVTFFTNDITTNSSGYFEGELTQNDNASHSAEHSIVALGYKNAAPQMELRSLSFSNQDLGTVYLYKKVSQVFITISTTAGISPSDTLFTTVNTTSGYREKAITNLSIPAGTSAYTIDTASNVIFTRYSFLQHQYHNDIVIRKSGAASQFAVSSNETEGDEAQKVYVIALP